MNDKKAGKSLDSDGDKILVSFYLLPQTLEQIDDLLFYAKKHLPIEKRRKLTKSVFYETGFKILIEDYKQRGAESLFLEAILKLMKE